MRARLFRPALFWLSSLIALPLAAQSDLSSYQGPGILSAGVGNLGNRSGQQVDLRFWGGVNAVYSTNLQPLAYDAQGNLIHVANMFGTSANFGAYGGHHWEHAQLGLSYTGNYIYYPDNSSYDGTNQTLSLGLTMQYSSRVMFDLRLTGSSLSNATGAVADAAAADGSLNGPQLFDSRASYVDVNGSMTFIQSPRTSYTVGASANGFFYGNGLTSSSGYGVNVSANHRVSASSSFGAVYTFGTQMATGYDAKFQSIAGQYFGSFARFWTISLSAGVSTSQIHQSFALLLPVIGGDGNVIFLSFPAETAFRNFYPTGSASLSRQFQRSSASIGYNRGIGAGNGLVLSGLNETARAGYSYTGVRKWNFGVDGSYSTVSSLGQPPTKTTWYGAGTGLTYEIARFTHLSARFDVGHYDLGAGYFRTTKQASVGVSFSPGNIPLSLW